LVAIKSCNRDRLRGDHDAIRNTWGRDLPVGVDLRFFIGGEYPKPFEILRVDEWLLKIPDQYDFLPLKSRAILKWAVIQHYDYSILVDNDTYVVPKRLFALPFQRYDYSGHFGRGSAEIGTTFRYEDGRGIIYDPCYPWASGGYGVFISKKMAEIVAEESIVSNFWAEDMALGCIAALHNLKIGNLEGLRNNASYHYPKDPNGYWSYDPATKWMEKMQLEHGEK
jgi:hypothetical protein